jgi:hypothetical protein
VQERVLSPPPSSPEFIACKACSDLPSALLGVSLGGVAGASAVVGVEDALYLMARNSASWTGESVKSSDKTTQVTVSLVV